MKQHILIVVLAIVLFSCKKEKTQLTEETIAKNDVVIEDQVHDYENTLNWEGSYVGILPCTDCKGENTEILLNLDHSYTKSITFVNSSKSEVLEKGKFIWLEDGCTIILDDSKKSALKVGFNTLTLLDKDRKPFTDTGNYILEKNICEEKDFEEFKYKGNDGKTYIVIFGQSCDGLFAEIKSDHISLQLLRETASELQTIYGNNNDTKLIDQDDKAVLRIKYKEIILTPEN